MSNTPSAAFSDTKAHYDLLDGLRVGAFSGVCWGEGATFFGEYRFWCQGQVGIVKMSDTCAGWKRTPHFNLLGRLPYFASGVSQQRNVAKQKNKPLAMRVVGIA